MNQTPTQKNEILQTYYQELKSLYETKATKELSFRTPLENLLKALKPSPSYTIIQEAKSEGKSGAKPDFDVYQKIDKEDELSYNRLIGFIECKDIDKDLDSQSEQIKRYLEISPNIILTNYRRFILLSFGKVIYEASLFDENLNTHLFTQENKEEFFTLISAFFADTSTQISSKAELIKVLSSQSFYLSIALKNAQDEKDDKDQNALFNECWQKTYNTFMAIQKIDFSELDFCDTIAQSIVYGLFVSFIENENLEIEKIDTHSFIELLPNHFKTLHEFIYFSLPAFALPKRVLYVLNNVKKTLALLDKASMAKFLDLELEKIAIYLYEDFLKEYDELRSTQKRKQGGVFYTPEPVVNMIVSCIDELLQSKFGKEKGFLDSEVKVLDFATGTGSFLASVFEKIIAKERQAFRNDTIKHKFLRDIYGFEISFVAYIVARLKLGQILKNAGFSDFSDTDFLIFLNNTLDLSENANFTMSMPLLNLDREWKQARDVKHNKNLLVILGNPPYNVKSKNKDNKILELLQTYKQGLNEAKTNLDDDYIKFIRFAQWKLVEQRQTQGLFNKSNKGLLGFITNNSFLDGRTHRKMRESLAKSFDEIYILNLHGNSDIDEKGDKNVFDITQGVCISIFVKYKDSIPICHTEQSEVSKNNAICHTEALAEVSQKSTNRDISPTAQYDKVAVIANERSECGNPHKIIDCHDFANAKSRNDSVRNPKNPNNDNLATIHYFSTKDNDILRRQDKFALLNDIAHNGLDTIKWQTLNLDAPYFWFVPKDFSNAEYENFWALANDKALGESKGIFEIYGSGNQAERDKICIHFNKQNVINLVNDFAKLEIEEIRQKYGLQKDSRDWSVARAKADIIANMDCHESANADSRNDGVGNSSLRVSEASVAIHKNSPSLAEGDKGGGFSSSLRGEAEAIHNKIHKIAYRPFDIRYTFFTGKSKGFWGTPSSLSKHLLMGENLGICTANIAEKDNFQYIFITDKIIDRHISGQFSNLDRFIPLYYFMDSKNEAGKVDKIPNFTKEFSAFVAQHKILKGKTPEQILAFIYANLYNPNYRKKYLEYLKIGFPRIDFEVSEAKFETLANLGQNLIDLHLMREIPNDSAIDFVGQFDATLPIDDTSPNKRYQNGVLTLNKSLSIKGITAQMWEYKIGGYEVLKQWLKYRKNYYASKEELEHFLRICIIIKATISIQNELEKETTTQQKDKNGKT